MTTELLDRARAALWRQDGRALRTNEEARNWLEQHPLCLLQPWLRDVAVPAPTLVEASLGEASRTPAPEAVEHAYLLLQPLLEAGSVVMLRLGSSDGEADFVVEVELLPWVIALAGDREWKQPPQAAGPRQTSQLALDVWKLLKQEGALTAADARDRLGGDLTKAAVLHALGELWRLLRVSPLGAPEEARWELMEQHHRQALVAGSAASQVTALSLIVSSYLQSVYAAAGEEIEEFLAPMAARSRIREAVRGLAATRQIETRTFGTRSLYLLEGTAELLEAMAPAPPAAEEAQERPQPSAALEPERAPVTEAAASPAPDAVAAVAAAPAARAGRPRPGGSGTPARAREQRPERREQKSGWRKFSSAREEPQGQSRGKGWEHPKRRFSAPSRPWLEPKEEDRSSGNRGREAGRRDEGGTGPRRFRDKPFQGGPKQGGYRQGSPKHGGGYGNRGGRPGGWTKERFGAPSEGRDRRRDSPAAESRSGAPGKGPKKHWGEGPKKSWGSGPKKPWGKRSQPFSGRPSRRSSDRFPGPRSADSGSADSRFVKPGDRGGWEKKPGKNFGSKPAKRFGSKPGKPFGSKPGKRFGAKPGKRFGSKPGPSRFGSAPKAFRGKGRKRNPGSPEESGGE